MPGLADGVAETLCAESITAELTSMRSDRIKLLVFICRATIIYMVSPEVKLLASADCLVVAPLANLLYRCLEELLLRVY